MKRTTLFTLATLVTLSAVAPAVLAAQNPVRWQRRGQPTEEPITVFHSPQSANVPTAETLRKGEWQFEVSHRFTPPFSEGSKALWGLDGPAFIRLGLTYAASDRLNVGILRTNLDDNLELDAKVRVAEGGRGSVPWMAAIMGGVAWNTQLSDIAGLEGNETQAYGQVILDALVGGKWALGVVPSLLYNPYIRDVDKGTAVSVTVHSQVYVHRGVSLMGEWNISQAHEGVEHDAAAFGIELETGGHFFKLMATNSTRPDPTQYLGGTPNAFTAHQLRFGFNITRLLAY